MKERNQASQNSLMCRVQFCQPSEEHMAADEEIIGNWQRVRIVFSFQTIFLMLVYNTFMDKCKQLKNADFLLVTLMSYYM